MKNFFGAVKLNWRKSLSDKLFSLSLLSGLAVAFMLISIMPFFYHHIESRHGYLLNDFLLRFLRPTNVSVPIFIIIWGTVLLAFIRVLKKPAIFLNYVYGFIVITLLRMICLACVPLEPPVGIVELSDPFTNVFYGGAFITKDLFFSGHTATMVLLTLALQRKPDKIFAMFGTLVVAGLLLVQHVHYSIDVLAAPVFAVAGFHIGQFMLRSLRSGFQRAGTRAGISARQP